MQKDFALEVRPNPRPVTFTFAPAGREAELMGAARAYGKDMVCLAFEPGREREGPVNIAVFEERNGELKAWNECDPWSPPVDSDVVLRARDGEFCFAYNGERLVLYHGRPEDQHVLPGILKARMFLGRLAAT